MSQNPDNTNTSGGAQQRAASKITENEFDRSIMALIPPLKRFARSLSLNASDGEDLLQDSLERALSHRAQWRGGNLKSWLFSITANLSHNRRRSVRRRPEDPLDDAAFNLAAPGQSEPGELIRLSRALETLNAENRAVLMLVAVEGYAYQEVADMLDIPIGTVMSRLSRARRQLSTVLADNNIVAIRRRP